MSILKVDKTIVPLFFQISYSSVSKIEICIKLFLDKNPKKQGFAFTISKWERLYDWHGMRRVFILYQSTIL